MTDCPNGVEFAGDSGGRKTLNREISLEMHNRVS